MRQHRLLSTIGVCVGLATGAVIASEPLDLVPLLQPPPTAVPPAPAPPPPPATRTPPPPKTPPPATLPPGATSQPTLAPVTNTTGDAPQSLASSGAGFTPYMMGDLPTVSYSRGIVSYPGLVPVKLPPIYATVPINPGQVIIPNSAAQLPLPTRQVLVDPGHTILVPGEIYKSILIPQVGQAAVKIDENESPRPMDRVYVTYNYFDNVTQPFNGVPKSNLNLETYGFELTFLNGDASIGLRMNSLQTTGDSSFAGGDFGDLTVITKYALVNDRQTGNVLSVGLAVTAPTGPDAVLLDGSRLNPVLIQPFSGFIRNWDRLYAQGFSSMIIPTDSRESVLATGSLALGYWIYRNADPNARISYIAPTVEGHETFGLTHRGLDQTFYGFPDTFVMTDGVHIGLGQRANLALGVAVPLTGPKIFNLEALAQLNWQF